MLPAYFRKLKVNPDNIDLLEQFTLVFILKVYLCLVI